MQQQLQQLAERSPGRVALRGAGAQGTPFDAQGTPFDTPCTRGAQLGRQPCDSIRTATLTRALRVALERSCPQLGGRQVLMPTLSRVCRGTCHESVLPVWTVLCAGPVWTFRCPDRMWASAVRIAAQ